MVTIYVEGGGDQANLKAQCRRAFARLLEKAGFKNKMPSIKALGGRDAAFNAFTIAHGQAAATGFIVLLVDSETIPDSTNPWSHLNHQSGWRKPPNATDDQAHLMVVCMETWLLADPKALAAYFGQDFKISKLPTRDLETKAKPDIYNSIAAASVPAKPKGKYGKARDSFTLLGQIDPAQLRARCSWAERFFAALEKKC